ASRWTAGNAVYFAHRASANRLPYIDVTAASPIATASAGTATIGRLNVRQWDGVTVAVRSRYSPISLLASVAVRVRAEGSFTSARWTSRATSGGASGRSDRRGAGVSVASDIRTAAADVPRNG